MNMYNIKVNENQAQVLCLACNLLSRIHLGQLDQVGFELSRNKECSGEVYSLIREGLEKLGKEFINAKGGCGIFSPKTHEDAKISWDLLQVIRHRLAWDKNPKGGWMVDFDPPMESSKEPLPSCVKEPVGNTE